MTSRISTAIRGRPLVAYFVLAYGITWLFWIPTMFIAWNQGWTLPTPFVNIVSLQFADAGEAVVFVLFSMAVYGPLVAALLVTYAWGGRPGLRELWGRMRKWRVGAKWYLLVFLLPLLLTLAVAGIAIATTGSASNLLSPTIPFQLLLFFFLYQLLTSGLEEPGWRGYALPKLQTKLSADKASWRLGFLWAFWHYPFVIYQSYPAVTSPDNPIGIAVLIPTLAGFTMSIVGWTYVLTWVYNSTRSVFLLIVLHAWANVMNIYISGAFQDSPVTVYQAILTWIIVLILLKRYGKEHLSARPKVDVSTPQTVS